MATLFAQSIIQFAPLRTFARIHTTAPHAQLIRELFPKALFDEQKVSYGLFIEIAWSFLSSGIMVDRVKKCWYINQQHRIGGLPATINANGKQIGFKDGERHRDDKDPKTGLTLPAVIYGVARAWYKNGEFHRIDKDPRTGLTLPATIWSNGSPYWYKDGKHHRDDKDPRTGLTLPAIINANGSRFWHKDDKLHRDDKDPQTGLTLPAEVHANGLQKWYKDGKLHRDDIDPNTGLTLPAIINATI